MTMSDGTCQEIDMKVIAELYKMVEFRKEKLVEVQSEYNALYQPNCTSCPGSTAYFTLRPKLVHAHVQYRAALGLFLNALASMRKKEYLMKNGTVAIKMGGKEFVPGKKKLRPHCEPWTMNATQEPTNAMCAIICRNEPSCKGFARDPKSHWCLWFDDAKPQPEDTCSSQVETEFLKEIQGPTNNDLWTNIQKLHVFDKAIVEALKLAGREASSTNATFVKWWEFEGDAAKIKLALREQFLDEVNGYTGTILDTMAIRKQYIELQNQANLLLVNEAEAFPPLEEAPPIKIIEARSVKHTEGFVSPIADEPKVLRWKDFPNSEDTAWSKIHPDCPMGAPCFCDCKCRGAPPQNFVEPPPLTTPCPPPPPLPNPMMLSAILTR